MANRQVIFVAVMFLFAHCKWEKYHAIISSILEMSVWAAKNLNMHLGIQNVAESDIGIRKKCFLRTIR
jgi:hypothetical protein